jgi:hypothetical protein
MARDVAETIVDLATALWKGAQLSVSLKCWCPTESHISRDPWLMLSKDPSTGATVVHRGPVAFHMGTQKDIDLFCAEMTEDLLSHMHHEYMEHDWYLEVVHTGSKEQVYIKPLGTSTTRPRLVKALSGIVGLYGAVKVYSGA